MRLFGPLGLLLCCFMLGSAGAVLHEIAAGVPGSQRREGNAAAKHMAHAILAVALDDEGATGDAPLSGLANLLANANASGLWLKWSATGAAIVPRRLTDNRPATLVGIVVLLI